jgi:glycerophosphoryl diester phosphodiesterase
MVKIIAHRGFWYERSEGNSLDSLKRAVEKGFGIETDVRDFKGEIVISHDIANENSLKLNSFLENIQNLGNFREVVYAWNIKSDGLAEKLKGILEKYGILENSFFFDMSFPTLYEFSKEFLSLNLATRYSDFEDEPQFYENCDWIWVDGFERDIISEEKIKEFIGDNKKIVFVSPEIHNRDPEKLWALIKDIDKDNKNIFLCTDWIEKAGNLLN